MADEFKRVYDRALKRTYSIRAEAPVEEGLVLVEPDPARGRYAPPEFNVTKSGEPSATAKKEA